ncbi:adenylylsulfate kinase [Caballeronia mineralivorans PML1(12)]|uniref:Adenylyl-sulfate kinase n=1 Tax=Caballeronia mineralivorans PML1(12) TaxID=908627 RepID=A0A0J1FY35_9BURK|nr:adenylyl-sulfate kinase [Caballeronia mineralivorans]KLU24858.1 adenylylsulfate kinase [Caballeronia mineralivorans PML1(12)]
MRGSSSGACGSTRTLIEDGLVLWLTGLPGAGKTTLSDQLALALTARGFRVKVLDGDVLRRGLNRDLGFSARDRHENVRRVGEVAALFADAGLITIVALISPLATMREQVRVAIGERFREVYVRASLDICEARDPKGLYQKARRGELTEFTGISAPYEPPVHADLVVDTGTCVVDECVTQLVIFTEQQFAATRDVRAERTASVRWAV